MELKSESSEELDKKIEKLITFFEDYAEDYLEDNTKDKIIKIFKSKDYKATKQILDSMDEKWIEDVKKVGKFYTFTDFIKTVDSSKKTEFRTSYLTSCFSPNLAIPALRIENVVLEKTQFKRYGIDQSRFYR